MQGVYWIGAYIIPSERQQVSFDHTQKEKQLVSGRGKEAELAVMMTATHFPRES